MELSNTKAILLLGGKGTRIQSITNGMPKAMLKIQGKTTPEYLIQLFKKYGITNLIFSVGYKAKVIKDYYGDGSRFGVAITYVEEDEPLGSAGAIKLASKHIKNTFFVTNGDELKVIDLKDMMEYHNTNKGIITVALTEVVDPSHYGVARLDGNRILEFVEKPKTNASSNFVNSGLSIWEPAVIRMIPDGFCMYEKELFPRLASEGKLVGYKFSGQWFDTGTPERYERANEEWRGGL
ncbi:MAG: nucleotidyltransferase family protein [archaeon]